MPCQAQDLEILIALNGQNKLSERDLLICRAYVYGLAAGFPTATDALRVAVGDGLLKVSERDLEAEYLALIASP